MLPARFLFKKNQYFVYVMHGQWEEHVTCICFLNLLLIMKIALPHVYKKTFQNIARFLFSFSLQKSFANDLIGLEQG